MSGQISFPAGLIHRSFTEADLARVESVQRRVTKRVRSTGKPQYDSVVIAGNGIGALTFAARLARSAEFRGNVTVVAPPVVESRRLINGVSLRGLAADYISQALGCTHTDLLKSISAYVAGKPASFRQTATMATPKGQSDYGFSQLGTWQGGATGLNRPLLYGARNTRVVAGMWELMQDLGIAHVADKAISAEHMRGMASGKRPLLVNATTNPTLLGAQSAKPKRMVVAVQAPFMVATGGIKYPLESSTALAPLIRRDGIIDVGYFTPFADPLSPRSSWYGIFARVVNADAGVDKDAEIKIMTSELLGVARSLGLEPDDLEQTLAGAMVPAGGFWGAPDSAPGTLELKRAYSGGNPCYYADGMLSSAIGGLLAAEAVIAGADADAVVRKALKAMRWHNFLWWVETTKIAGLADALMRVNVNLAMAYPHSAGLRHWAAVA